MHEAVMISRVCRDANAAYKIEIDMLANRIYTKKYATLENMLVERKIWDSFYKPQDKPIHQLVWMDGIHKMGDSLVDFVFGNLDSFYDHSQDWKAWERLDIVLKSIDYENKPKLSSKMLNLMIYHIRKATDQNNVIFVLYLMTHVVCSSIKRLVWVLDPEERPRNHLAFGIRMIKYLVAKSEFVLDAMPQEESKKFKVLEQELKVWLLHLEYNRHPNVNLYQDALTDVVYEIKTNGERQTLKKYN
jgi:hypothetical protein